MHAIEEYRYKTNRALLLIIGIWPYQNSALATAQRLLVVSILASGVCIELAPVIIHEYSAALIIEALSFILPTFVAVVKYYYFYFKAEIIKQLLEHVQADWNLLKDKHEREIIESYTKIARIITFIPISNLIKQTFNYFLCTLVLCCGIEITYMTMPIVLYIINDVYLTTSNNNTYSQYIYIPIDYSVNQQKYIYVILMHFIVFFNIAVIIIVAVATFTGVLMIHACGLLKIASYRIERAIDVENIQQISPLKREYIMYMKILQAVNIQQKALKFTNRFFSTFAIMYIVLVMLGVASVSLYLFRLFQNLQTTRDMSDIFLFVSMLIGLFMYIFLANNTAQEISDHCSNVFHGAYNSMWYVAPLRIQKLILFLLQYGARNFNIVIGGIFVSSLEGFATILSTSLSYCMVIYSTQLRDDKIKK